MSEEDHLDRRLATVLFADVVGYTRMSETDEEGTHRVLRVALTRIADVVAEHQGTIAHYAGDAVLVEFATVMNGLNCAVEIQRAISELSKGQADGPPIRFRIGLNVGDVISDRGEIYGDTVNTAVRLQNVADPGGICISEAVRNAIGRQLPIAYEFVGEERLKNLSIPVRAYRALLETNELEVPTGQLSPKPTVAVLPLEARGGSDVDGDSLTEDMIRELSRFRGLEVIAHNSTFVYKGTPTNIQQVGRDLGAHYVMEGHVRRASDGIRINVQLINADTGRHLWSEVYDTTGDGSVGAFDETVRRVVANVAGRVHVVASEAAQRRPVEQLHAFEHVLRAQGLVGKGAEGNERARSHYRRALALEPRNARALVGAALTHVDDWWNGWSEDAALEQALELAQQGYGADTSDSKAHWALGLVHLLRGDLREGKRLVERATRINPNDADAIAVDAMASIYEDDGGAALASLALAFHLNQYPSAWYRWVEGLAHLVGGNAEEARFALLEGVQQNPSLNIARACLVAVHVMLGDVEAARSEALELHRRAPVTATTTLVTRMPGSSARREALLEVLDDAGLAAG